MTKLRESLVFQVKIGTTKCFFTCIYRNPSSENNTKDKVDEFSNELEKTLNNIKGKNPFINFVVGDLNAKNTAWWGETTDYVMNIRRSLLSVNWERCIRQRNPINQAEFLSNYIGNNFANFPP